MISGAKCLDSEVVEEIDDGHSSSGTVLRKSDGRTESSSSGGVTLFASSNHPRASAVRTFENTYVGGDRTPRLKIIDKETQGFEHDLHMAYRLPLQRLSDRQLALLLSKNTETSQGNYPQMDRIDMINKVQENIVANSQKRLIRPTLLTNINMFPEEITIDSQPAVNPRSHQRTTVASLYNTTPIPISIRKPEIRRSQKQIPELNTVDKLSSQSHRTGHNLKDMKALLHQVKMRYDVAKLEYLRKLRELNNRKITLATPKKMELTKTNGISTKDINLTVDNEAGPEEVKRPQTTEIKQEFSMVDNLKKFIAMVKANKEKIFIHDGGNEEEVESENEASQRITPPRASAPPKVFATNTEEVKQETHFEEVAPQPHPEVVPQFHPIKVVPKLHYGGNSEEEQSSFSSASSTFEHHEEHSSQKSFSFNMKKVGDITTSELLEQLNEEVRVSTTTTPSTTTTEFVVEESVAIKPEIETDEEDLADFASESHEEAICDAISCNFEKGDLCQWEASADEISPGSPLYRRRHRQARFVQRTWHNWQGRYRNRVTGIARAQVFSFENQRFAAAYVRPFQRATLTGRLLSGEQETIRFRAWEATRNVQLKLCCDNTENCVFETEIGVFRGSRRWREFTATCPAGTSTVIFECINHGIYQGACGLDNIHLANFFCPQVIPFVSTIDNDKK
ncbi:hypothetical protein FO519_000205 [Halicephalobus sp. NKZ332]|nr:hypothetical protein FO519_000205 [Halicephalobus sp. NKZ332]